jgi:GAF domain-containing protein
LLERQPVQIADVQADPEYRLRDAQRLGGFRTHLGLPLLRKDSVIGVLVVSRAIVDPFDDKHIKLLSTFAARAVIAIENARLLNELRQRTDDLSERTTDLTEALDQQTATSKVLQVISGSPGDLQPVFATMLANMVRVCNATLGAVYRFDGDAFRFIAQHNTLPAHAELARYSPFRPGPKHYFARMIATKTVDHVADVAAEQGYLERRPEYVTAVELGRARTALFVPMLKENILIGVFALARQEVRPFTDKQIELVQNFAAQAVIAIENARLLNELRQSLEQQTATADVLKVVSSSPGDLQPVFETMLGNAIRICHAKFGVLALHEDGGFRHVALHGVPAAYAERRSQNPTVMPDPAHVLGRLVATKQVVHIADSMTEPEEGRGELVTLAGARTMLIVPMLKEQALIGAIGIYRQEVRPFSDNQIELVRNFANQAVIAIENARLLNELRQRTTDLTERTTDLTEALEQQTATSEVLAIISASPGNLEPVFAAMLEKAVRICDAGFGNVQRWDGATMEYVASYKTPPAFADARPIYSSSDADDTEPEGNRAQLNPQLLRI